ncbi:tRNA dimethylallyltransferase [hydrothermal vent metagenome]|uniref:tRNA dimethylallyltransferase n=1 Tax=hydrothermal vent metagenome TaxID=652676 RepID=A0A3B1BVY6_9ZZZZ
MTSDAPPLLILTGPTASGKSEVGVTLAERLNTEIISADSVQVYRRFNIGSAKPGIESLKRVRHHLIDIRAPEEKFNVADFQETAGVVARDLWARGKVPLMVGGSLLYIKGVTEGLSLAVNINIEVDAELDRLYEKEGQEGMYERMREVDPASAERVHKNDTFRTRRALGVYMTTGKTMSQVFAENPAKPQFDSLIVSLDMPREDLYRRIEERTEKMLASGWRDEIIELEKMGYNGEVKPMRSVGYRILYEELIGERDAESSFHAILKETKAFAKRQLTWLRNEPGVLFETIGPEDTAEKITDSILKHDEVIEFLLRHQISL